MQPAGRETATVQGPEGNYFIYGGYRYRLGDLVGGISANDIQWTASWASAVEQAAQYDSLNQF